MAKFETTKPVDPGKLARELGISSTVSITGAAPESTESKIIEAKVTLQELQSAVAQHVYDGRLSVETARARNQQLVGEAAQRTLTLEEITEYILNQGVLHYE